MQVAHLGAQRRLIAHGRGQAAQQRRHLGASLDKAEDVVDEEQDIAALVAEILGHGDAGQADAQAGAGRLVHLAEDQHRVLDHAAVLHLVPQVVALAAALAHAREDRIALMELGDVIDQFLDDDGLAHARAAEDARLAALGEGGHQVDHLDAGLEYAGLGRLLDKAGRWPVDGVLDVCHHSRTRVEGLTEDVEQPAQRLLAHRHHDRRAGVDHVHAAAQPVGAGHGHSPHAAVAKLLLDLADQHTAVILGDFDGVVYLRQLAWGELGIHHRAKDGDNPTD